MKLLKYLLCIIFLLVYVAIGFVLVILNATLGFLKTIPHVWRSMLGKRLKKREILSNGDVTEVFKATVKETVANASAVEIEKINLSAEDVWVSYMDREGHD